MFYLLDYELSGNSVMLTAKSSATLLGKMLGISRLSVLHFPVACDLYQSTELYIGPLYGWIKICVEIW